MLLRAVLLLLLSFHLLHIIACFAYYYKWLDVFQRVLDVVVVVCVCVCVMCV